MNAVASFLARRLWWWMLWLMRRPLMKRWQQASMRWLGPSREPAMRRSFARQNAFARKIGLPLITVCLNILVGSIILLGCIASAIELRDSGLLTYPGEGLGSRE